MSESAIRPGELLKEPPRPIRLVPVRPARDQEQLRVAEIAQVRGVPLVLGRVVLGAKVPAAPPRLITHAPIANAERRGRAVGRTELGERAGAVEVAVLDPV